MILATCQHHILKPYTLQSEFRTVVHCLVVTMIDDDVIINNLHGWYICVKISVCTKPDYCVRNAFPTTPHSCICIFVYSCICIFLYLYIFPRPFFFAKVEERKLCHFHHIQKLTCDKLLHPSLPITTTA